VTAVNCTFIGNTGITAPVMEMYESALVSYITNSTITGNNPVSYADFLSESVFCINLCYITPAYFQIYIAYILTNINVNAITFGVVDTKE